MAKAKVPASPRSIDQQTVLLALLEETELGCSIGRLYSGLLMHVLLARNPDLKKSVKDTRAAIRQRKREFDRLALGYLS